MIDSVVQLGAERTHCKSAMMGWPASVLANSDQRERRSPKLLEPNESVIYVGIVGSGPLLLNPMTSAICVDKLGKNECSLLQLDKEPTPLFFIFPLFKIMSCLAAGTMSRERIPTIVVTCKMQRRTVWLQVSCWTTENSLATDSLLNDGVRTQPTEHMTTGVVIVQWCST